MTGNLVSSLIVLTVGSTNSMTAIVTTQIKVSYMSTQKIKLAVINLVLVTYPVKPINLFNNRIYVTKVLPPLKMTKNIATTSTVHKFLTNI